MGVNDIFRRRLAEQARVELHDELLHGRHPPDTTRALAVAGPPLVVVGQGARQQQHKDAHWPRPL